MWKTALLLIFTLIIVPVVAFYYGEPLHALQWEAIHLTLWVYLIAAGVCFAVSSLTDNYSQVDKLWSIMPVVYAWIFAALSDFESRLLLMAALITIWGVRLTYNFWRRGGYSWRFWSGEEDYRWSILRKKKELQAPWKWTLFNFFFISYYQMGLIWLITLPMVKAMGGGPLNIWDGLIAIIVLSWIVVETIADQQQWNFQKQKRAARVGDGPLPSEYRDGFIQSGLWQYVRHPNYSAEQAVWISLYFFSISAGGDVLNWSLTGALLLIFLFRGSSDFSERITTSKYPAYQKYQQKVGRFLPF